MGQGLAIWSFSELPLFASTIRPFDNSPCFRSKALRRVLPKGIFPHILSSASPLSPPVALSKACAAHPDRKALS